MITWFADFLKVGYENAKRVKAQRENEARKEIEEVLFNSQCNSFHIGSHNDLGFPYEDSQPNEEGLYRFLNMEKLDIAKRDLEVKDPRYDFTTGLLHGLPKTYALFNRYGVTVDDMRNLIKDAIAEAEPKYKDAIVNDEMRLKNINRLNQKPQAV